MNVSEPDGLTPEDKKIVDETVAKTRSTVTHTSNRISRSGYLPRSKNTAWQACSEPGFHGAKREAEALLLITDFIETMIRPKNTPYQAFFPQILRSRDAAFAARGNGCYAAKKTIEIPTKPLVLVPECLPSASETL